MNKYLRASIPLVIFPLSLAIMSVKAVPIDIPPEIVILGEKMDEATRMGDYSFWYYYSEEMAKWYGAGWFDNLGSYPVSAPTPPPSPPKSCKQVLLDIEDARVGCRLEQRHTADQLAEACPDYIFGGAVEAHANFGQFGSIGINLSVQQAATCEARLGFHVETALEGCEKTATASRKTLGPCD
jgi:hypothetical protein